MLRRNFFLLLCIFTASTLVTGQTPSRFIHIDQFGYQTMVSKVAVLSDPQTGFNANESYTPGQTIELRSANNGSVVWSGAPTTWNGGATDQRHGDKGWWVDFSNFTTPGEYYLFDPSNNEQSATFEIGDAVYSELLKDAGRAFFYNRCNYAKAAPFAETGWTDGMNFHHPLQDNDCSYLLDPENASLRRDLSGGWFDAGDYNKYVTFAETAVHSLLWAVQESPAAFTDNWNIPESGNGIPDILDEIKWEMDWLMKMTNPDGSVIIKMGSISHSDNFEAPPSVNNDRRYYGPTCTSASIAAASMLAHAAEVFATIPAFSADAQLYEDRAIECFEYWTNARNANNLETDCDDGTIKAGDADRTEAQQKEMALTAAAHLYALTETATYKTYFDTHYTEAEMLMNNFWGPYKEELTSAMLYYTSLSGADPTVSSAIRNGFANDANNNWNGFFGMQSNDLYRAFMPDWSFHWGSNSIISRYGNLNRLLNTYGLNSANSSSYSAKAAGMLHYLHGVNPLGTVYLSGMEGRGAERGIQEIYHSWFYDGTDWDNSLTSLYGPAPGFVTGGPNKDFSVTNITPPAGEPAAKSYKDWNTGFPENSWEISEPAIYYQAGYIRNLAAQMVEELILPVVYHSPLSATAKASDVLLKWEVASEINASHYEVQHLNLQDEWVVIGQVDATNRRQYQFLHEKPVEGPNSYRLKQVDYDGRTEFSNVATVYFKDLYAAIKVFPNPAAKGQVLHLSGLPDSGVIRMYNAQGRLLKTITFNRPQLDIQTAELARGWYGVELVNRGKGAVWQRRILLE